MVYRAGKLDKSKYPKKIKSREKVKRQKYVLKQFTLYANIGGYRVGAIIPLKCHGKTGIPMDPYWRRRLRDAAVDGCIKVVKKEKKDRVERQ